jgi:hypothetical protein
MSVQWQEEWCAMSSSVCVFRCLQAKGSRKWNACTWLQRASYVYWLSLIVLKCCQANVTMSLSPFIEIHWRPIDLHIDFKILLLTYKSVNVPCPSYLCALLLPYKPAHLLCSPSNGLLVIARSWTSTSNVAPRLWNFLSEVISSADCVSSLKHYLKTHLFGKFWPHDPVLFYYVFIQSLAI